MALTFNFDLAVMAQDVGMYDEESEAGAADIFVFATYAIENVEDFDALLEQVVSSKSKHGSGGMQSKIEAAAVTKKANIETWIVNGLEDNFMVNAMHNKVPFTKIK